jgi:MFS family permease
MLSLVTINAIPQHRCYIEGLDTGVYSDWNTSGLLESFKMKEEFPDSCLILVNGTETKCSRYVYDDTFYKDTRSMDWNMVCDDRFRGSIAQTVYMLGVFTGAVTLGECPIQASCVPSTSFVVFTGGLADKIGRKKVFCWSATLQLILGVGVAFIPEYFSFLFVRYLYGIFGSAGSYITGFVLTMELVGPSKRTPCGVAFQAAFAGGIMLVAGWASIIKDRQMLQVVYGLHGLLLFAHWWLMDESPRWLWNQGRQKEAVDIVARGVKTNRRGVGLDKEHYLTRSKPQRVVIEEPKSSAGISDLFKSPNLRIKTLNVCLCWFANSIAYYGLSLSSVRRETIFSRKPS